MRKEKKEHWLFFRGRDSRGYPVYEDESGILWKDFRPVFQWTAELWPCGGCVFMGEDGESEGEGEEHILCAPVFLPRRDLWEDPVSREEIEKMTIELLSGRNVSSIGNELRAERENFSCERGSSGISNRLIFDWYRQKRYGGCIRKISGVITLYRNFPAK